MKYLIDTSVWLWSLVSPERLNRRAREVFSSGASELYLSSASSWEICIKLSLGKMHFPGSPAGYVPDRMAALGIRPLPITHAHALAVCALPGHHRDPFDRVLIAQAQTEAMVILTADRAFEPYAVKTLWCK